MLGKSFGAGAKKEREEQQRAQQKASRHRLTWINGNPTIHDIRLLLAEAQTNKGILCELPIRSSRGVFLLSCTSDHLSPDPCWTMYEGEDGSKQLWNYMDSNVDMISDVVCMSVIDKNSKTEVRLPDGSVAPAPAASAAPAPAPQPAAPPPPEIEAAPAAPWGAGAGGGQGQGAWPAADPNAAWGNQAGGGGQPGWGAGAPQNPGWGAGAPQPNPGAPGWGA
ncbi:MAG: hypothetical protein ACREJM_03630, partial [Candidatus Saccharimonadales bacterium]